MSHGGESIHESVEGESDNRRQHRIIATSTARRKLFHQDECNANEKAALQDNLENMLNESRQQARDKWNFDFETEQPLAGHWQWEKVDATLHVPNYLANAVHLAMPVNSDGSVSDDGDDDGTNDAVDQDATIDTCEQGSMQDNCASDTGEFVDESRTEL